jgi:F420-non-reducing hydrogenase small subunit
MAWVYGEAPTVVNPERIRPEQDCAMNGEQLALPEFYDHVYALNQVVAVDYYLPGCPPPLDLLLGAIQGLLGNQPPQPGSILAPAKSLCDSCSRNRTKPARMELKTVSRPHETVVEPEACFLAHGVICLGPVTRDGCGGSCLSVNAPCRGCFGPVAGVCDSGARFLASLASLLAPGDEAELRALVEAIADPAGYACRFTQPVSILGARKLEAEDKQ